MKWQNTIENREMVEVAMEVRSHIMISTLQEVSQPGE